MSKFERKLRGDFTVFVREMDKGVLGASMSASYEDGGDYQMGDVRCAVRVYERYSMLGSNRVSMSVTVLGRGEELSLCAVTSGGSQAVLFKMNTFGEEAFLNTLIDMVGRFEKRK